MFAQKRFYVQCNIALFLVYLSAPITAIAESKFLSFSPDAGWLLEKRVVTSIRTEGALGRVSVYLDRETSQIRLVRRLAGDFFELVLVVVFVFSWLLDRAVINPLEALLQAMSRVFDGSGESIQNPVSELEGA